MANENGFQIVKKGRGIDVEYIKFADEIVRKNLTLETVYNQVIDFVKKIDDLGGYKSIDNMKSDLNDVKKEIEAMSVRMQEAMDALLS